MGNWRRLYYLGMALAMLIIVTGELIWLPDPLRFGEKIYWIDVIDMLVYVLILIPLIWMVASLLHMFTIGKSWDRFGSGAVFATGTMTVIILLTIPKKLEFSASAFLLTWLFVFVDLFFHERLRRKVPIQCISVLISTICLLFLLFWPTQYMVTYPGLTLNMNRYAQANGGSVHGEISGVLVFERPAFPIDWLYAQLFPNYTFEVENLGMSLGEYNQEVRNMKADANAAGSAIAFQKVGKGKGITSHGVRITAIVKNSPVAGIMQLGDVIEKVSGHTVTNVQELTDRMKLTKPGDQVEVLVLRGSQRVILTAGTRANPDDPNRAAFGIQVSNEMQYDIPGIVMYHNYLLHEGGPSHGAMLALTLIDQLTPYGVTYGNHVAGTGTMEPDGSVGPVGGLEQKAYTVSRTAADVFFVPTQNESEARSGAPDLQIVPVHTIDDMLNWLRAHPIQKNQPS